MEEKLKQFAGANVRRVNEFTLKLTFFQKSNLQLQKQNNLFPNFVFFTLCQKRVHWLPNVFGSRVSK